LKELKRMAVDNEDYDTAKRINLEINKSLDEARSVENIQY